MGYITRSNLLFVKRFPVYDDRVYSDMAATTVIIWYNRYRVCELEPEGPRETLKPGERASFTEEWWLLPYQYPQNVDEINPAAVDELIQREAK